jgi:hypothetical protein
VRPLGAELPAAVERVTFEEVLRTGKPVVGALVDLKLLKGTGFVVRVPVIRDGVTKYVLSAGVNPKAMLELLVSQELPANWVAGVVDRNGRIVARTREPERYVGQFASKSLLEALARVPQGWFQGTTFARGRSSHTQVNHADLNTAGAARCAAITLKSTAAGTRDKPHPRIETRRNQRTLKFAAVMLNSI